jgi:orotidine-5'-phosphate decarboxylase
MTESAHAHSRQAELKEKLIVALDVGSADAARKVLAELRGMVGAFKVGLQLFSAAGPDLVREFVSAGERIFLDLKFHDIPQTAARAGVEAAKLGVWMFNVHALGGLEMMRRTSAEVRDFCELNSITEPKMIAVTVLTSSDANTLTEVGIERAADEQVLKLAKLAEESDFDGVVASAAEAGAIRNATSEDFLIVTPGIRPRNATNDDQKRVMTPGGALQSGSDYLVIGRPIIAAENRAAVVESILGEMEDPANV